MSNEITFSIHHTAVFPSSFPAVFYPLWHLFSLPSMLQQFLSSASKSPPPLCTVLAPSGCSHTVQSTAVSSNPTMLPGVYYPMIAQCERLLTVSSLAFASLSAPLWGKLIIALSCLDFSTPIQVGCFFFWCLRREICLKAPINPRWNILKTAACVFQRFACLPHRILHFPPKNSHNNEHSLFSNSAIYL